MSVGCCKWKQSGRCFCKAHIAHPGVGRPACAAPGRLTQTAYLKFEDALVAFTKTCRRAASFQAEDEEVEAALGDMAVALDGVVAAATA
eukprot:365452-Chlamydomonas_euryale.AAC.11